MIGRPVGKAAAVNSSVRLTTPSVTHMAANAPSFWRSASSTYATMAPACVVNGATLRCIRCGCMLGAASQPRAFRRIKRWLRLTASTATAGRPPKLATTTRLGTMQAATLPLYRNGPGAKRVDMLSSNQCTELADLSCMATLLVASMPQHHG